MYSRCSFSWSQATPPVGAVELHGFVVHHAPDDVEEVARVGRLLAGLEHLGHALFEPPGDAVAVGPYRAQEPLGDADPSADHLRRVARSRAEAPQADWPGAWLLGRWR